MDKKNIVRVNFVVFCCDTFEHVECLLRMFKCIYRRGFVLYCFVLMVLWVAIKTEFHLQNIYAERERKGVGRRYLRIGGLIDLNVCIWLICFSCLLSGLKLSIHIIAVRAYDENMQQV